MPNFTRSLGILYVLCAFPTDVRADEAAVLRVTRQEGAESCPDEAALLLRVESIRGKTTHSPNVYEVTFGRDSGGLSASIRSGQGARSRVLRDRGPSCSALERATAVTIALLLDSDADAAPKEAPPAAPVREDRPMLAEPSPKPAPVHGTLSFGGGAVVGVLAPIAPALFADGGIALGRFRTSIGVFGVFAQTTELAPGAVRQSLLSGFARTCLAPVRSGALRLDVCSGIYAGVSKAQASGFTRNESATTPWLALPLELALASVSPSFGWELGAAALVPLRHHEFAVDGVGVAYEPTAVGGLLSLRVVGLYPL